MPGSVLLAASLVLAVAVPLFFLRSGTNPDHEEVVPLVPLSASRSPRVLEPCTPLATGDGDWRLSLPVLDDLATSNYRVEILTMDGQPVTTRSVFGPTEAGFIVELSKTGLTAGRYLLYLIDGQPEESVLIERFCIEILDS